VDISTIIDDVQRESAQSDYKFHRGKFLSYVEDLRLLGAVGGQGRQSFALRRYSDGANREMSGHLFTRNFEQGGELRELPPGQYVVNTDQEIDVVLAAVGKAVERQIPGSGYSIVTIEIADPNQCIRSFSRKKAQAAADEDFKAIQHWYQVEFARYCFEVVRDSIPIILERGKGGHSLEYYVMTVGLICTYARPFTNNRPVGKLDDEIVPDEFKNLHYSLIAARDQLFAHGDPSLEVAPGEFPNEAVIIKDGGVPSMHVSRSAMKLEAFDRILRLAEALIEKAEYYINKYQVRFAKQIHKLPQGQFRLNVVDSTAPLFMKLSEAEG
jgi:hypothetical protein